MVKRGELTDEAWAQIAPLMPENGRRDGTWERLLSHAQTKSDAVGEVEWEVGIDSTVVRAHQHAAGARGRPSRGDEKGGG